MAAAGKQDSRSQVSRGELVQHPMNLSCGIVWLVDRTLSACECFWRRASSENKVLAEVKM